MPRRAAPKPPAQKAPIEEPIIEPEGAEVLADAEPISPAITWVNPKVVTNHIKGVELHLGDGRVLAFGDSAEVSEWLARFLRERGQAE